MGKKIYAQSNSESEYVKCVYRSGPSLSRGSVTGSNGVSHILHFVLVSRMSDIISRRQRTPWFWPDFMYYVFGDGREHDSNLRVLHSFTSKVSH